MLLVKAIILSVSVQNVKHDMLLNLGTGNGMAKSLLDSCGEPCAASNATLSIIRGMLSSFSTPCQFY